MKKFLPLYFIFSVIFLISIQTVCASSLSNKPRLAILPYANKAAVSDCLSLKDASIVSEFLMEQLLDSGRFKIVERAAMREIVNEHSFNMSGLVDTSTAVSLGRLAGAQYLVAGSVTGLSLKESGLEYSHSAKGGAAFEKFAVVANITLRIIDLEDGTVVLAASGTGESARTNMEFTLKKEIANEYETTIEDDSGVEDVGDGTEVREIVQTLTIGGKRVSLVQARNALYKAAVDVIYNKDFGVLAKIDGKAKRRKV